MHAVRAYLDPSRKRVIAGLISYQGDIHAERGNAPFLFFLFLPLPKPGDSTGRVFKARICCVQLGEFD